VDASPGWQREAAIPAAEWRLTGVHQVPVLRRRDHQSDRTAELMVAVCGACRDLNYLGGLRRALRDAQQRNKRPPTVQFTKMLDCQLHTTLTCPFDEIIG
jgi:hypothetical protein